jgi:hypothetical protein
MSGDPVFRVDTSDPDSPRRTETWTWDETGRFREIPGTDGAIIRLLIEGDGKKHQPLALREIGLTWVDVEDAYEGGECGCCLRNAVRYIHEHGGTLMLGRFHNLDHGTNCCHAWVKTDDGKHVDPSGQVPDGWYEGIEDPHGWAERYR